MRPFEKADKTELFEDLPKAVREEAARIAREIAYQRTRKREITMRDAMHAASGILNVQKENQNLKELL